MNSKMMVFGDLAIDPDTVILVSRKYDSDSNCTIAVRTSGGGEMVIPISMWASDLLIEHFKKKK